uniref:Uncharacterized protein n=1 Tax=Globodera rostochiensis TaxID=31243 RepID=A0A914HTF5_GLORO
MTVFGLVGLLTGGKQREQDVSAPRKCIGLMSGRKSPRRSYHREWSQHYEQRSSSRSRDCERDNKGMRKSSRNRDEGHGNVRREESVKQSASNEELLRPNITINDNDVTGSVVRQAEIDRIEGPGFQPSSFRSDADTSRAKNSADKRSKQCKPNATKHDKAMFGPMWARKEIEREQMKRQADGREETLRDDVHQRTNDRLGIRFPLAHDLLSHDAELRNQQWKELFKERRKKAMDGLL